MYICLLDFIRTERRIEFLYFRLPRSNRSEKNSTYIYIYLIYYFPHVSVADLNRSSNKYMIFCDTDHSLISNFALEFR